MPPWGLMWKGQKIWLHKTWGRNSCRPWSTALWRATWQELWGGETRTYQDGGYHMGAILTSTPCTVHIKQLQVRRWHPRPRSIVFCLNLGGRKKSSFHHLVPIRSVRSVSASRPGFNMQRALQSRPMPVTSCFGIWPGSSLIGQSITNAALGQRQLATSFAW